jgi:hypothetical protein
MWHLYLACPEGGFRHRRETIEEPGELRQPVSRGAQPRRKLTQSLVGARKPPGQRTSVFETSIGGGLPLHIHDREDRTGTGPDTQPFDYLANF